MGMRPSTEDWEQLVGSDLVPHLIPAGPPGGVRRPADVSWLPPGAHQALGAVVGRPGLEDLLIVPAAAWPCGGLRRRCLYAPLCVLGAGERAAGLWVQALAVTSREVIIACRPPGERLRRGRVARELYIPRQHIEDAGVRSGTLLVRSAGRDLPITLGSSRLAAAASSWLVQVIGGYDHTRADS